MNMTQEIAYLLIHTSFTIYTTLVLLRMLLALARADFYNPMSQFIVRATQPILKPMRMVLPPIGRLDTSSLLLAYLLKVAELSLLYWFIKGVFTTLVFISAIFQIIILTLDIYFFAIIVMVIASWIAPNSYNPILSLIDSLLNPILRPIRSIMPRSSIDFSPMIVILIIYIIQIVLKHSFGV